MSEARQMAEGGARLAADLGPVAVFMIVYNVANRTAPDAAIFIATGVFIVATLAALAFVWRRERRVSPLLLVSAGFVTVFGGLTIALRDELFIMVAPTITNLLYATALFGGLAVGRNVLRMLFGALFSLPDRIWNILAVRWGVFFVFLAILNEVIWRTFPEVVWANFKFWGVMPITIIFALANLPLTIKHTIGSQNSKPQT